jgi:hypothetical protein
MSFASTLNDPDWFAQNGYAAGMLVRGQNKKLKDWAQEDFDWFYKEVENCTTSHLLKRDMQFYGPIILKAKHEAREANIAPYRKRVSDLQSKGVITDQEIDELNEIKARAPEISEQVDNFIQQQPLLKQKAAEAERRRTQQATEDEKRRIATQKEATAAALKAEQDALQKEKETKAQKAAEEAEREHARLEAQLKNQQDEKIEEDARIAFEKSLPSSCKTGSKIQKSIMTKETGDSLTHAGDLAAAGEKAEACDSFTAVLEKVEESRSAWVQCSKELGKRPELRAKEKSNEALSQAITLNTQAANYRALANQIGCEF